jgi:hypothetical protein
VKLRWEGERFRTRKRAEEVQFREVREDEKDEKFEWENRMREGANM